MRRITLTQFLVGRQQSNLINADLRLLLETIARACKGISTRVNKGALAEGLGGTATSNVHGEVQKKLDVLSNEILLGGMAGAATSPPSPRRSRKSRFRSPSPTSAANISC